MWHNVTQYGSNMSVEGFRWRGRSFQWVLIVFWCITSLWWSISRSVMKFCFFVLFFNWSFTGHNQKCSSFCSFFWLTFLYDIIFRFAWLYLSLKEVKWKWKMFQMSALTATNLKNSLTPAARVSCDCVMLWGGVVLLADHFHLSPYREARYHIQLVWVIILVLWWQTSFRCEQPLQGRQRVKWFNEQDKLWVTVM